MFLRKFIILNKQNSQNAKGHAKLEVRNAKAKLSLSIESIEGGEDSVHKVYMVSDESSGFKEIELGIVEIDKRGRGKIEIGFNADSVSNSDMKISEFNILILKRESKRESEVILGGYLHSDDDSISKIKNLKRMKVEEVEEVEEIIEIEEIREETEKIEEEIVDEVEMIEEKLEEEKRNICEEVEEIEEIKEVKEVKIKKNHNTKTENYYNEQIASYTLDILNFFNRVYPFKIEFEDYKWWRIDYGEMNSHRGFLPYYSYILDSRCSNENGEFPTCQNQVKKHSHYLFGVVEKDEKITHYVYAIPGRYQKSEHPYGGATGFVTWLEDKAENGYWLSYIDASTGNIVRPC